MANTCIISIDPSADPSCAEFNPRTLTAAKGDLIYWRNNTSQSHKLVLKANPSVVWIEQIPGKLPNEPAPTSQKAITFNAATAATGIDYICADHQSCVNAGKEIGTIIVK
jgi:plastocyanin